MSVVTTTAPDNKDPWEGYYEVKVFYKNGEWVCIHCEYERRIMHIAVSSHRDYTYDVCNCRGAQISGGTPWYNLN